MRRLFSYFIPILTIFFISCNSDDSKLDNVELETKQDSIFYCIGTNIADQFLENSLETGNPMAVASGLSDAINQYELLIPKEEKRSLLMELSQTIQMVQQQKMMQDVAGNKNEGVAFLTENKNKSGVIELESGLQYKIIKEGSGSTPTLNDSVTVHYRGSFVDGSTFESSYDAGRPVTFPLGGVIPGWREGLQYMKLGAVHELYVPSNLAYGDQGNRNIQGGKTLIFQVELLDIR